MDADDWFDKRVLAQYIEYLKSLDVDLMLTDYNYVYENSNIEDPCLYSDQHIIANQVISIEELLGLRPVFHGQMHGFTYKTKILREMNYHQTEGISYTDQEFVDIPFTRVKTVCYYPNILYNYLLGREGATMMSIKDKSMGQLMQVVLRICDFFCSSNYSKLFQTYLLKQLMSQFYLIYSSGLLAHSYNIDLLKEFDTKLEKFSLLYRESDKITRRKIPYVRLWRKNNRRESFLMKLICKP